MRNRLLLLLLPLLALPAPGQTLRLVKDINPFHEPGSSDPNSFAALGDTAFFSALESATGAEPWRSDGTVAGTWRLSDVFGGDRSSHPTPIAATDRQVFFTAERSPEVPRGLWVTNGTPDGTAPLTDAAVGSGALWVPAQRALYFAAGTDGFEPELWRSDGTAAGTKPVADALDVRNPADFTLFQGRVWFSAASPRGRGLWVTDGTVAGTAMVKAFSGTGPNRLQALGSRLLFMAPGAPAASGASDLWVSDGTAKGTRQIVRLARVFDSQVLGGRLWFVADDGRRGQELWISDGTPAGTRTLTSFARRNAFGQLLLPPTLTAGRLVFAADDGPHGAELWISDGTARGTRLVRDVCPGSCPAVLSLWRTHRGLLYWTGSNGARGAELWVSDGTATGTRLVRDICRGSCGADPQDPFFLADRVLFGAVDNSNGRELWSSDGTAGGTERISDFALDEPWEAMQGVVAGGELLFAAEDELGTELWRSDGAETSLVLDINDLAFGGSYPETLGAIGSQAFFYADDGVHGHELWKSDGTEGGTSLVADLEPGPGPSRRISPDGQEAGGRLFFLLDHQVWRTDGTAPGTFPVTRVGEVNPCCGPWVLRALGDRVYFGAQDADHGFELWTSDGTVAGTRMVKDLRPNGDSEPRELTVFEGQLYLTAAGEDGYRVLWRTDGTGEGTVPVADLGTFHSGTPSRLTVHDGRLWFFADDAVHGFEPWSTDGTEAGTALELEIFPGPSSLDPNLVVSLGGKLLISGFPNSGGDSAGGLWATDGTQAGTRPIGMPADGGSWIVSGGRFFYNAITPFQPRSVWTSDGTPEGTGPLIGPSGFQFLAALDYALLGDRVLFNSDLGRGLWVTDGTTAGTVRVTEGGFEPFVYGRLQPAGERVFFPAHNPQTGVEPWVVEP
jgi:ELWxxDGT repeat protein